VEVWGQFTQDSQAADGVAQGIGYAVLIILLGWQVSYDDSMA
jgi:hypothetical protein